MKHIYIIVAVLMLAAAGFSSVRHIPTGGPGNMYLALEAEPLECVDTLSVSGPVSASDLSQIRLLCGRAPGGDSVCCRVKCLDLSGARFCAGPDTIGIEGAMTINMVLDDVMPALALYRLPISGLILPEKLDSIGDYAFWGCDITRLEIPDGVRVSYNAVANCPQLQTLRLPDMHGDAVLPATHLLPALRRVRYGDVDMVPSGGFQNSDAIEEVVFDGRIGHIDGYQFKDCGRLRSVVFNGPVFSTGGPVLAQDCPALEEIRVDGLVLTMGLTENPGCGLLSCMSGARPYVWSSDSSAYPPLEWHRIAESPVLSSQLTEIAEYAEQAMQRRGFVKRDAYASYPLLDSLLRVVGDKTTADRLRIVAQENADPDAGKTKLQILKESAPYSHENSDSIRELVRFSYASPADSLLALSNRAFGLDSVAGNGDDLSKIKNLLYWVHDQVRHDGSSSWPDCRYNLRELIEVCKRQDRGLNCRFMAEMLAEACLAVGIPARYVTCMPKKWDEDPDCHVICVAWAESLGKWVWVDPTFAAYVTDENGLMLHPGEVRERMRQGLPLVMNSDANWNQMPVSQEYYLDEYMAKNLYIMMSNTIQQSEPEGKSDHKQGIQCALVPVDTKCGYASVLTSDSILFWSAPSEHGAVQ